MRSLACYDIPSVVARELLRRYGCVMKTADIVRYDPTTTAAQQRGLAKKWVDLFHMTRDEFTKEMSRVDCAHRATRLRMLSRAARHFEEREFFIAMADMLERIAKECGDAYTNRREVTGKGGAPLAPPVTISTQRSQPRRARTARSHRARREGAGQDDDRDPVHASGMTS